MCICISLVEAFDEPALQPVVELQEFVCAVGMACMCVSRAGAGRVGLVWCRQGWAGALTRCDKREGSILELVRQPSICHNLHKATKQVGRPAGSKHGAQQGLVGRHACSRARLSSVGNTLYRCAFSTMSLTMSLALLQ